jgi:hypothetical protein
MAFWENYQTAGLTNKGDAQPRRIPKWLNATGLAISK